MSSIPSQEQEPEKMGIATFVDSIENAMQFGLTKNWINDKTCKIHSSNLPLDIIFYLPSALRINTDEIGGKMAIHVDLDVWLTKPEVLLNRILTLCGKGKRIYGRETAVARIDKKMAMDFQHAYHLQVALPGKYRYGLFKDGELLSVAIYSGLRKMHHTSGYRSIELLRFCHKGRNLVVGGLSKVLSAMARDFYPNDVMTYVDKDWSSGKKFEKLGFVTLEHTKPQRFIIDRSDFKRYPLPKEQNDTSLLGEDYVVMNSGSMKMVKIINGINC